MAAWKLGNFTSTELALGLADDGSVVAGDGLPNLLKYGFGLDPRRALDGPLTSIDIQDDHLTIAYQRLPLAADLSYAAEVADELAGPWHSGSEFTEEVALVENADWTDTVTVRDRASASAQPHRFIRVRIVRTNFDTDGDSLPDDAELRFFGSLAQNADGDFDGDGVSNGQELADGTDPTDYYNGLTPQLEIVSGDGQTAEPDGRFSQRLRVRVSRAANPSEVLANAPVLFTLPTASGALRPTAQVRTDADGLAEVQCETTIAAGAGLTAQATAAPAGAAAASVTFHLTAATERLAGTLEAWIIAPHRVALVWSGVNVSSCLVERRLGPTGAWTVERQIDAAAGEALAVIAAPSDAVSFRLRALSQAEKIIRDALPATIHPLPTGLVAVPMASCPEKFNRKGQFGYVGLDGVLAQAWDGQQWQTMPGGAAVPKTVNAIRENGDLAGSVDKHAAVWQWDETARTYTLVPVSGLESYDESYAGGYWRDGSLVGTVVTVSQAPVYETVNHVHAYAWNEAADDWLDLGEFATDAAIRAALGFVPDHTYSFYPYSTLYPYQNVDNGTDYATLPADAVAIWWGEDFFNNKPSNFDFQAIPIGVTQNFPVQVQVGTQEVRSTRYFLWLSGTSTAAVTNTPPVQPPSSEFVSAVNDRGDRVVRTGGIFTIQTTEGTAIPLTGLPGTSRTVSALSHYQQIGGGVFDTNYVYQPYLRFADDSNQFLPVPTAWASYGGAVFTLNRYGWAGGALDLGEGGGSLGDQAALWRPDGTYVDLNTQVISEDPGLWLRRTISVNDASLILCATGDFASVNPSGKRLLLPVEAVSRDKFLAGSITIPSGWNSLEMEFVNTTSGENLGRYGSLLGGGTTKIYNSVPEIMSETDAVTGWQPESQKVWFVRNSNNPRKVDYYTCFNAVGSVAVNFYLNGSTTPTGAITHELTPAPDFAGWINYVNNWVAGVGFEFLGSDPPPLKAAGSTPNLSEAVINNLTRACLIPLFNVVTQVEGAEELVYGVFEGVRNGLKDDWGLATLIFNGAATTTNWAWVESLSEIQQWRTPAKRSVEMMQMLRHFVEGQVFNPLVSLGQDFTTWEGFKKRSWEAWSVTKNGGQKIWALSGAAWGKMVDGVSTWFDDFNDRMMVGAEKIAFSNVLWNKDQLLQSLAAENRVLVFRTGYIFGYLCEQVAVGKGLSSIAKVAVRSSLRYGAILAGRTTFAVGTRLHLLKKGLQSVALASELDAGIEKGLVRSATEPLAAPLIKDVTGEIIEGMLSRTGFQRDLLNYKVIADAIYDGSKIKQLMLTTGKEALFFERLGQMTKLLDTNATGEAVKGFLKAYERMIIFDGSGLLVKDNFDELIRVMRADSPAKIAVLNTALEQYARGTGPLDLEFTTFMYAINTDPAKILAAGEHTALVTFRDRVEILAPEAGQALRRYEGVAAARYELKYGQTGLHRPTVIDIPDLLRRKRVDYTNPGTLGIFIDVKGPIMTNEGLLELYPISSDRISGLASSAIDKINDNFALIPPLPTLVVIDFFGLEASEVVSVKKLIQASGLDMTHFLFLAD